MSLKVNPYSDPFLVYQELIHPIDILTPEIILEIFAYLNLQTLATCTLVRKEWKQLASTLSLWKSAIYTELAFGNNQWAKHFGEDVVKNEDMHEEFASLPLDIVEDYKRFQKVFPKENARNSLMLVRIPKTLNGGLTLKSLGQMIQSRLPKSTMGYRTINTNIFNKFGNISIKKSRWVIMTNVLPESRGIDYLKQIDRVAELAKKALVNCKVPKLLEASVCIFAQYFSSNKSLFSNKPWTYTRCREGYFSNINEADYPLSVGGLVPPDGLHMDYFINHTMTGVAAIWVPSGTSTNHLSQKKTAVHPENDQCNQKYKQLRYM